MKKIFAAILIIMLFLLTACNQDNSGGNNDDGANIQDNQEQEVSVPEEDKRILSNAPVKDFEGYEYRILSRGPGYALWEGIDADAEEITGEPINDAVFSRNRTIEEKYNISIVNRPTDDIPVSARTSIMANSDEYDIMMGPLANSFANVLSQGGMLADLKNIAYIDLAKPWYDQNANAQLSIGGKLYVTMSDIGLIDKNATWSYLFNKKMVADLSLDDPYKLVREGTWTIDKMLEMSKDVAHDLNGDGKMGIDDRYGYAGESYNLYIALLSAGHQFFKKNNNDLPEYAGLDNASINSFEKLMSMLGDKNLVLRADDWYSSGHEVWGGAGVMDNAFRENRVLFFDTSMARVVFYRDMDADFGIVPPPKRDSAQQGYISSVSVSSCNSLTVPITVSNFERTGIITDALAAESMHVVIPAYYDVQLKTKMARDEESGEMLDIIYKGRIFDLGLLYDWGGFPSTFAGAMQSNATDIVSRVDRIEERIKTAIEKTVDAYASF